jgi:hypothetical protein
MTKEIRALTWNRHKHVAVLNQLMGTPIPSPTARLQRFYECSVYVYILVPFGNLKWFPHKDIVQNGTLHKQKF